MFAQRSFRGPAENLESRLVTFREHERALEGGESRGSLPPKQAHRAHLSLQPLAVLLASLVQNAFFPAPHLRG